MMAVSRDLLVRERIGPYLVFDESCVGKRLIVGEEVVNLDVLAAADDANCEVERFSERDDRKHRAGYVGGYTARQHQWGQLKLNFVGSKPRRESRHCVGPTICVDTTALPAVLFSIVTLGW
jgi:hypothetical protein